MKTPDATASQRSTKETTEAEGRCDGRVLKRSDESPSLIQEGRSRLAESEGLLMRPIQQEMESLTENEDS
jgi:hypothetical protein